MSTGNLTKWWPSGEEMTLKERLVFNAINDHDQAITLLKEQVNSAVKTVMETITNTVTPTPSPPTPNPFPYLGTVNDQLGNPLYLTQLTDNGAKIIAGDSSPVTITLNSGVTPPWFTIIVNDSSAAVTLLPDSGATYVGAGGNVLYPGGFAFINFDGSTFWA